MNYPRAALSIALAIISSTALAAEYPAPKQGARPEASGVYIVVHEHR